jgi:hypothetical protein
MSLFTSATSPLYLALSHIVHPREKESQYQDKLENSPQFSSIPHWAGIDKIMNALYN